MQFIGITLTGWVAVIICTSMAIIAGLMFILGKEKVHFVWGVFCFITATWAGTFYIIVSTNSPSIAELWWKIAYVSIILIPFLFSNFVLEFIESDKVGRFKKRALISLYSAASVLIILDLTTNLIIDGVSFSFNEFYYAQPGILHPYFTFLYFAIIFFACWLVYREYKTRHDNDPFRQKAGYFFFALIAGFVGASLNFFPVYNIEIHPVSNITVIFGSAIIAFAILRYRLFNLRIVTAQLLTLILVAFMLIRLIISRSTGEFLLNATLLVITLIIGVFLIKSVRMEVEQREHIQKLAQDLEKANVRLTELDRQKSEFVSFATHQLRAPLTAMKGYSSLLLDGDMGELPQGAKDGVSHIYESAKTLTSIVDDYLNISRIELGTMKYAFETIDLQLLVTDVIAELKPNIDKTGLAFTFKAEPSEIGYRVTADRDKMKQVIANLIDNSVKYTPKGKVEVTLEFDKETRLFVFKIKDTGVGIAPETLPHLFQKFTRAQNANKVNMRGTGLGLYVARQIIEAHQGIIRVESPGEGKGSTFIVELEPFEKA